MKFYYNINSLEELKNLVLSVCELENGEIKNSVKLEKEIIYTLAFNASVNDSKEIKDESIKIINKLAEIYKIKTGSNYDFYQKKKNGEYEFFTVPAINSRMITLHTVRSAVKVAENLKLPHLIFELALSEMGYTGQDKQEYVALVKSAYISLGIKDKTIYLQADHYQLDPKKYEENSIVEIERIKNLIQKAVEAGVYNIDIDTSKFETIDNNKTDKENQFLNAKLTADLLYFVRNLEKEMNLGLTISIGGEVGEVGGGNTKYPQVNAYLEVLKEELEKKEEVNNSIKGLDKVSINVGSAHGGVLGPDGKPLEIVPLDFQAHHDVYMKAVDPISKQKKVLSVQHGASTLPKNYFPLFPAMHVAEVHLATGFQNIVWEVLKKEDKKLFKKMTKMVKEKFADKISKYETKEIGFAKENKRLTEFVKKELLLSKALPKIELALEIEFANLFYSLYNILQSKSDNIQKGDRAD